MNAAGDAVQCHGVAVSAGPSTFAPRLPQHLQQLTMLRVDPVETMTGIEFQSLLI
eukprot:SAG31_NODE_20720_length_567_cov_0.651709_1_plen_54_part_10